MSKYRGPRLRVIRRLGDLPSLTQKIRKRNTRPGQHGANRRKITQFAYRLIEKQKLRFYYGISEKQLVRLMRAVRKEKGSTGQILIRRLEIRLDNIIYRLGWSRTLPSARQLVGHGHILVNNSRLNICSFVCSPQQVITVQREEGIRTLVEKNLQDRVHNLPSHLSLNKAGFVAVVNQWAHRRGIPLDLSELLVIEYYSNRL